MKFPYKLFVYPNFLDDSNVKIVLALQGKEQLDEATLIQQNGNRDINLCFL